MSQIAKQRTDKNVYYCEITRETFAFTPLSFLFPIVVRAELLNNIYLSFIKGNFTTSEKNHRRRHSYHLVIHLTLFAQVVLSDSEREEK